jgi:hypothetical protein
MSHHESRFIMFNVRGSNAVADHVRLLIAGALKHYPNGSTVLSVGNVSYTVTSLIQVLQDFVDQRNAVLTARATVKAKLDAERARAPDQLAVIRAFEKVVRGTFGNSADVLADFGLPPARARTPQTAEQKAVSAAKSKATRAARHTMGKVQKKDVKGAIKASLVVTALGGTAPAGGSGAGTPPTGSATGDAGGGSASPATPAASPTAVTTPHA